MSEPIVVSSDSEKEPDWIAGSLISVKSLVCLDDDFLDEHPPQFPPLAGGKVSKLSSFPPLEKFRRNREALERNQLQKGRPASSIRHVINLTEESDGQCSCGVTTALQTPPAVSAAEKQRQEVCMEQQQRLEWENDIMAQRRRRRKELSKKSRKALEVGRQIEEQKAVEAKQRWCVFRKQSNALQFAAESNRATQANPQGEAAKHVFAAEYSKVGLFILPGVVF